MRRLLEFFKTRSVMFYVCCGVAVLSFIEAFIYKAAVTDARYYSDASFFLALFAFLPFGLLSAFRITERCAPAALIIMVFLAFLTFLAPQSGYMGDMVYGASPSALYVLTIVFLGIELVACVPALFMRVSKKTAEESAASKA